MSANWKWAEVAVSAEKRADGSMILSNQMPPASYPKNLVSWLHRNGDRFPDKPFLQERSATGKWEGKTYAQTLAAVNALSNGLTTLNVKPSAPIAILSENCIDMALIQLAAMQIGQPIAPISLAYSVRSQTGSHIKHILDTTKAPVLVMSNADWHMPKLSQWDLSDVQLFAFSNADSHKGVLPFTELYGSHHQLNADAAARFAAVQHDTLAKIQFTSGSTGLPKGVMISHGMMTSNQTGLAQIWPFLDHDEVVVDWLPWNHTFGGNYVFNLIMMQGGILYLDNGNPTPAGFERTVRNIISVSPTMYFGVPRSYTALFDRMKADEQLQHAFFRRLKFIFTAAAALDQATYEGMKSMSQKVRGETVPFFSAWGCTETAPSATNVYWPCDDAKAIGLPLPGVVVKLAPDSSGKTELRVKGPNVTGGYYRDETATQLAFDSEGYYQTGDAGVLLNADDPSAGLAFDGRIGEDFKLTSGVWVHNARLRSSVNRLGQPYLLDVVVAAPDREYLAALIYPNVPALRERFGEDSKNHADDGDFLKARSIIELFRDLFRKHNAEETGSSRRFVRFTILEELPQIDRNETTDKGYINQRAVLESHADLVNQLYSQHPPGYIFSVG